MVQVMVSPQWFLANDTIIQALSAVILLLIAGFALRCYFLQRKENKNYLYFGLSFIILTLSFLFKIATNITVISKVIETKQLGFFTITYTTMKASKVFFLAGHFGHYMLMLIGLYILYVVLSKKSVMNHLLILYFIVITTIFTDYSYYMFHLTSLILLAAITYRYYEICKENKNRLTKLIVTSFGILTASQIVFLLVKINTDIYAAAQALQLLGFVLLLIAFILVIKHGKKKQK